MDTGPHTSTSGLVGGVAWRVPYFGVRLALTPLFAFAYEFSFMAVVDPWLQRLGLARAVPWIDAASMTAWTLLVAGVLVVVPLLRATHAYLGEVEAQRKALRDAIERRTLEAKLRRGLEMAPDEDQAIALLQRSLRHVAHECPSVVLLADSSRAHLRCAVDTHPEEHAHRCPVEYPRDCPAARTGHTLLFEDATDLDACPMLLSRQLGARAALCVPVSASGQVVGVVHTVPTTSASDGLRSDLELVVREFGTRLSILRAMASSQRAATRDPLTGLLNRRSFDAEAAELSKTGRPYVVAMLDADHFKRLNDTHGHVMGDRALCALAGLLEESFEDGCVGRVGGEEFAVVLPCKDIDSARERFDAFRSALPQQMKTLGIPSLTVSVGLVKGVPGVDVTALLRLADQALYEAKRRGRNAVVVAGDNASSSIAAPSAPLPGPMPADA